MMMVLIGFISFSQTNNYFGATGTISGSVWSTIPAGPYTSPLVTTGGAIINFGNPATPTGASVTVVGINATANTTWTAGGTLTTGGTVITINVSSGITLNMAGQLLSTAGGTGFIKSGLGTLVSSNGNTYGGGFTLNAGTMAVGGVNAMGGAAGNTLVLNGGILTTNSGTARNLAGKYAGGITIGGDIQIGEDPTVNTNAGNGNLSFDNNISLGSSTRTITLGNSGTHTFSGIISNTSGGVTIDATVNGTGNIVFSGANTYSGTTTVNAGLLRLNRTGGGTLPSSNNVLINGGTFRVSTNQTLNSLTLAAGATLTVDAGASLTINGTFNHNGGTITGTGVIVYGNAPFGILSYGGATTQTTTSIEFPAVAGPSTLQISNPNGVNLHANRTLLQITFTNGHLILGTNNITIDLLGTVFGANSSRYVVTNSTGSLIINGVDNNNFVFPVGPSTTLYHPATISNSGNPNDLSVRVSSTNPPCADPTKSVNATWDISASFEPVPTINCNLTLVYTGATTGVSYVPAVARIIHCTGATADYSNGSVTGTVATGSGFTTFSPFGISSDPIALPVSLLSFAGQKERGVNVLRWSTANEFNNTGFEILRSTDGIIYTVIGFVNSLAVNGNSNDVLNYNFTDNAVTGTKQYYRLRQIDFDNRSNLSTIVLVKGERPVLTVIDAVFPNPASSSVNVLIAASEREKITLVVADIAGRVVSSKIVSVEQGSNTIPMDINQLNKGSYVIRLVCENGCNSTAKFMKL